MKKLFKQTLAIILALATVFGMCVFASASTYAEGSWWSLDIETGHLTVHCDVPYIDNRGASEILRYVQFIKSVSFEEGVTAINKNGFACCSKIEKIELPESLDFIGPWAFSGCSSLKEIKFPDSLTYIGTYAFSNCINLESIVIPPRVTVVSECAFQNCSKLESVEITNGKTYICGSAFRRNQALKTVRLPENADIDSRAFHGSEFIETVYYSGDEASYNALKIVNSPSNPFLGAEVYYNQPAAVFPVGISVASMPERTVFGICEKLDPTGLAVEVEMTDGTVEVISDLSRVHIYGFDSSYECESNFTVEYFGYKVYVPYSVIDIQIGKCGENVFWQFDVTTGVLLLRGGWEMYDYDCGTKAPWYEFRDLIRILRITGPIKSIGKDAFKDCNKLEAVYFHGNASHWRNLAGDKEQLRDIPLYMNNVLHEHSYTYNTVETEPTCLQEGVAVHYCECGEYQTETLPAVDHISGDWEIDSDGETVKKCTMCGETMEVKEAEPEEIPDEEITQPETSPEETPETEESVQPEEKIENVITEIFETIGSFFKKIFSSNVIAEFLANLFR